MKKYNAVKNITVVVSMFLASFLVFASQAIAGSNHPNHFAEELANKGITENPEHLSGLGTGEKMVPPTTTSSSRMGTKMDHFVEERAAKGIADDSKHLSGLGAGHSTEAVRGKKVFPSTRDTYNVLFDEERMVKGIK
ncbi:MAG: hypothetical protein H8E32_17440 [Nitrospinae bacterium]|nr:hypothetical protein [Nitrospinota bacterium]